jgi:hypothetical protein
MDRRDRQLLDKQLGRISSGQTPIGTIATMLALFFFMGLTLGGTLSSNGDRNTRAAAQMSQSSSLPN